MSYADMITDAVGPLEERTRESSALVAIAKMVDGAKDHHARMVYVHGTLSVLRGLLKKEGFAGESAKLNTFNQALGKKLKTLEYGKQANKSLGKDEWVDIDDDDDLHEVRQGSQDVVKHLKKGGWVHVNVAGHTYEVAKNKMGSTVSVRAQKSGKFGKPRQFTTIEDALSAIDLGDQTSSSIISSGTF